MTALGSERERARKGLTQRFVELFARGAILFGVVLMLWNLRPIPAQIHGWISAVPLALIGIAYALLQVRLKPDGRTLARRLLLSAAFVFWAVDQLLPPGRLASVIGDAVISAYVLDLFWVIEEH